MKSYFCGIYNNTLMFKRFEGKIKRKNDYNNPAPTTR